MGAPGNDNNGSGSGSARVFSGVDGSVLYTFEGDSTDERFGSSVSGAGDVNGDGVADLIVGAPFDRDNGVFSGNVRVFSGVDGSIIYSFDGDAAFEQFGQSVSGVGDVNGDGVADFLVSAFNGFTNDGFARLFVSQITGPIILGDCNQDGVVTFADIPAFVEVVASGGFLAEADCNEDTVADLDDIPFFIAILIAN